MGRVQRDVIRGLYGIVESPEEARPLLEAGVRIVQLRMKKTPAREVLAAARRLRELTRARGVAFCVNDRVDIALLAEADAVHLGQDDLPLAAARAIAPDLMIGISTHSLAQAQQALAGGADYLGFGPIYATTSKENPDPVQGVARLAEVVRAAGPVPVVAIGGITEERAAEVAHAGAGAAALISAVNRAPDPLAVARAVQRAFIFQK